MTPAAAPPEAASELLVATASAVAPGSIASAAGAGACAQTLIARAPLFWTRLVLPDAAVPAAVDARLRERGVPTRYVASAERPSLAPAPTLDCRGAPVARPDGWPARRSAAPPPLSCSPGTWFLRAGEGGVGVERELGRAGAGTRLAVVDDDALEASELELDAEVLVGIDEAPRHQPHGPLMVAWAAGTRTFAGVAPRASARLYLVPKPGEAMVALPLAIVRAVLDGADVIVCATYVDGSTSPMLDDALEVAARLGRRGRGTIVVLPAGRETSSTPGSTHASFSLGLGEPASDPRVFCVAPGARGAGWFFWRDRRARFRPFANRGPAVRWLSPGDDLAYPFTPEGGAERLCHAESSGAAAVAAGVLLLVLAANPTLRAGELGAVVDATLVPVAPEVPASLVPLADPADALPDGRDRDGHNAKHGLGLLCAGKACLAAMDPVCAALLSMGEDDAARTWASLRRDDADAREAYSPALARWAVRVLLADRQSSHALRVVLRHLRLVAPDPARVGPHGEGALLRHLGLLLRRLRDARVPAPRTVRAEVGELALRVEAVCREPTSPDVARRSGGGIAALSGGWGAEPPSRSLGQIEHDLAAVARRAWIPLNSPSVPA